MILRLHKRNENERKEEKKILENEVTRVDITATAQEKRLRGQRPRLLLFVKKSETDVQGDKTTLLRSSPVTARVDILFKKRATVKETG